MTKNRPFTRKDTQIPSKYGQRRYKYMSYQTNANSDHNSWLLPAHKNVYSREDGQYKSWWVSILQGAVETEASTLSNFLKYYLLINWSIHIFSSKNSIMRYIYTSPELGTTQCQSELQWINKLRNIDTIENDKAMRMS